MSANDTAHIKAELLARIHDLARELAPDCSRAGKYWLGRSPLRADKHGGSFWITILGPAAGAWRDEATGEKGDVFGLIAAVHRHTHFRDTLQWAKRWLNYEDLPAPKRAELAAKRKEDEAERLRAEAEEIAALRRKALGTWLHCQDRLEDTPADRYLREARGIDIRALARRPSVMRYQPEAWHSWSQRKFPCIVSLVTDTAGKSVGIHRVYLAPDGRDKAPVKPTRTVWPRGYEGGSIKLARGETGMPPNEAAKHGLIDTLCLCEGIEDGLSLALACPELRIWAACNVSNLQKIVVPDCSADVIVAADNDWGKPAAQAQLNAGVRALAAQKRPVRIARSHTGKDANDALRS